MQVERIRTPSLPIAATRTDDEPTSPASSPQGARPMLDRFLLDPLAAVWRAGNTPRRLDSIENDLLVAKLLTAPRCESTSASVEREPPLPGAASGIDLEKAFSKKQEAGGLPASETSKRSWFSSVAVRYGFTKDAEVDEEQKRLLESCAVMQENWSLLSDEQTAGGYTNLFDHFRSASLDIFEEFFEAGNRSERPWGQVALKRALTTESRFCTLIVLLKELHQTNAWKSWDNLTYIPNGDGRCLVGYENIRLDLLTHLSNFAASVRSSLWRMDDRAALVSANHLAELARYAEGVLGVGGGSRPAATYLFSDLADGQAVNAALRLAKAKGCPLTRAILLEEPNGQLAYRRELQTQLYAAQRDGNFAEGTNISLLLDECSRSS